MLISQLGGVRRAGIGLGWLALSVLVSRPSAAQTLTPAPGDEPAPLAPPPSSPPPALPPPAAPPMNFGASMDLSQPAPPPLGQRTYHWHDGFYARVDGGLGTLLHANISGTGGADLSASGLTLGYDLLLGGSIAPGFTLGGTLLGSLQLSGNWEANGQSVSTAALDTLIIGPFAEGYPNPEGGLHFGGALGLARAGLDLPGGIAAYGVGGAFWAGSDVWVAPDWSIGGLLRLDALYAKDNDAKVSSIGLTLMFSVLFN